MLKSRGLLLLFLISFISFTLIGCNAFKKEESSQPNYKELKQMVIDIMQTEDGKKAIQESVGDTETRSKLILSDDEVKKMVQNELLSEKNKAKLKSLYEDPKFANDLAKILKKENEQLQKDLLKDPEYRKMLIETMNNKDFEEIIIEIMKSNEYRTQMMLVMKESLESPMFKYDLLKLMEEASKEALKPDKKKAEEGEDGQKKDEGS